MGKSSRRRFGALVSSLLFLSTVAACTTPDPVTKPTASAPSYDNPLTASQGAQQTDVPACAGAGSGKVGVFRETQPAEVDAFESWLGCRIDLAIDYPARDTWADIANPTYLLKTWSKEPRRLVLGVAMLPEEEEGSIAEGAAGDYDKYFRELAKHLVAGGQSDAILRVGWEFNIAESRWFTGDAKSFTTYWRRIVEVMKSVEGADFVFDWNPNNGKGPVDASVYYPGDDVVDFIGIDAYDVSGAAYPYPDSCDGDCRKAIQTQAWDDSIFGGDRGLKFWREFAVKHRKGLSIPEWGLWNRPDGIGGGEDAAYIARMHAFMTDPQTPLAYQAYFEFNGDDGEHSLMDTFTDSGKVFIQLLTTKP